MTAPSQTTELSVGDEHYRAYVGPPDKYDTIGALQFAVLVMAGVRENHSVLDIGCGSLRGGRLLIPYLAPDRYCGVEPNEWLVSEGLEREVGADLAALRRPRFSYRDDFTFDEFGQTFDYLVAQSVLSHASREQVATCLASAARVMDERSMLLATWFAGPIDHAGSEWVYPGFTMYREATMRALAAAAKLRMSVLDWPHPSGQTWGVFQLEDAARPAPQLRAPWIGPAPDGMQAPSPEAIEAAYRQANPDLEPS